MWSPTSTLSSLVLTSAPVWLSLHDVPPPLWSAEGFELIASGIGEPLPSTGAFPKNGSGFPRVRALVSLQNGPLPTSVIVEDDEGNQARINISYPNFPPLCPSCSAYGHRAHRCPLGPPAPSANQPPRSTSPLGPPAPSALGKQTNLVQSEPRHLQPPITAPPSSATAPVTQKVPQGPTPGASRSRKVAGPGPPQAPQDPARSLAHAPQDPARSLAQAHLRRLKIPQGRWPRRLKIPQGRWPRPTSSPILLLLPQHQSSQFWPISLAQLPQLSNPRHFNLWALGCCAAHWPHRSPSHSPMSLSLKLATPPLGRPFLLIAAPPPSGRSSPPQ